MNGEPVEELYFKWLYKQVHVYRLKNPEHSYWNLLKQLHSKEFVWLIPNDDNRIEDGKELRFEFLDQCESDLANPLWLDLGCSMLEMLIGLSRRLSFQTDREPREWFWELIDNLGITYNDKHYDDLCRWEIDDVVDTVIWRRFSKDGFGGLFPLENSEFDQRKVEIWYQASAYLIERL